MSWQPPSGDPFGAASAVTPSRHDSSSPDVGGEESDQATTIRPVDPLTTPSGPEAGYPRPWPGPPGSDPDDSVPTVLEPGHRAPGATPPSSAGTGSNNSPDHAGSAGFGASPFGGFAGGLFDDNVIGGDTDPVTATLVQPTAAALGSGTSAPPPPAPDPPSAAGADPARDRSRPPTSDRPMPWFITRTTVGLSAGILGLFVGLLLIPVVAAPPPAPVVQTVV
ncbi:MAG: hypothetical protein L0G99_03005, partial [Propionibacteriales bacterium]|nr:hypothetical protein [Propionibacteriales bacterium]